MDKRDPGWKKIRIWDPDKHPGSATLFVSTSVMDPHHVDADPDSTYHPDADPDVDPESDFYLMRIRIHNPGKYVH